MTKAGTDLIGSHSTRKIRIDLFEAAIFVAPVGLRCLIEYSPSRRL